MALFREGLYVVTMQLGAWPVQWLDAIPRPRLLLAETLDDLGARGPAFWRLAV